MRSLIAAVVIASLGMAPVAGAQESGTPPAGPPAPAQASGASTAHGAIDPSKLGVDLAKVQKGVAEGTPKERLEANGLRLDYNIQVFGKAPPISELFENFDVVNGPTPFSGPTHADFLSLVTPQEYRAPAANFSALAFWAIRKISDANARAKCEAELDRYRARILAGEQAAAPRCVQ